MILKLEIICSLISVNTQSRHLGIKQTSHTEILHSNFNISTLLFILLLSHCIKMVFSFRFKFEQKFAEWRGIYLLKARDSLQTDELLLLPAEWRKPEVCGERGETIMIMIHGLALSQSVCCDELCEMLITESYLEITDPERSRRSLSGPTGHWRSMISVSCPRPH